MIEEINIDLLLSIIALIGAVGGFFGQQALNKYRIKQLEKQIGNKMDKDEHDDRWKNIEQRAAEQKARIEAVERARSEDHDLLTRIDEKLVMLLGRMDKMEAQMTRNPDSRTRASDK
jgi:uncharacterized coiled-coil protein SlyX